MSFRLHLFFHNLVHKKRLGKKEKVQLIFKRGKEREKQQKCEYLEDEKSFLDEIKSIFHNTLKTIIW